METAQILRWDDCQALIEPDEARDRAITEVAQLDFTMLKRKVAKKHGWSQEMTALIEDLYRKFLVLNVIYPGRRICPTGPIDEFWHAHILDTRAYAADCERIFGGLLHHFPYFGMRGAEDRQDLDNAFQESRELFIRHFGIDPCRGRESEARGCSPQMCPCTGHC